jgi:membrane-anchored protein YejM (alkaline phosphatase superfamily)
MNTPRNTLFGWSSWFILGNTLFLWLIALRYLYYVPWLHTDYLYTQGKILLSLFLFVSYLGQFALLALLPLVVLLPLIFLWPKRSFIFTLAIVLSTLLACLIVADTVVYGLYRFHLNGFFLDFILNANSEKALAYSKFELFYSALLALALMLFELFITYAAWRLALRSKALKKSLLAATLIIGFCVYLSYTLIIYSAGTNMGRIFIEVGRVFPLYTETLGALLPTRHGREKIDRAFELNMLQPEKSYSPLNYPLQPLQFSAAKPPLNVVVIVVDTWRFDMLNAQVTPAILKFSKKAWTFERHFSGGNSTGPGIFSIFYGQSYKSDTIK